MRKKQDTQDLQYDFFYRKFSSKTIYWEIHPDIVAWENKTVKNFRLVAPSGKSGRNGHRGMHEVF